MKITSGKYKGQNVETTGKVRPTLSKVRESVFSAIKSRFFDKSVSFLDLYSGSGIMSLEAVSRGYEVTAIEIDRRTARNIRKNFTNINEKCDLKVCDCTAFLKKTDKKFDVIYIDPPWSTPAFKFDTDAIVKLASNVLKDNGLIILEYEKNKKPTHEKLNRISDDWLVEEKTFGHCKLSFYEPKVP